MASRARGPQPHGERVRPTTGPARRCSRRASPRARMFIDPARPSVEDLHRRDHRGGAVVLHLRGRAHPRGVRRARDRRAPEHRGVRRGPPAAHVLVSRGSTRGRHRHPAHRPRRARRGAAAHRVPAGAGASRHLPGRGVPQGRRHGPGDAGRRARAAGTRPAPCRTSPGIGKSTAGVIAEAARRRAARPTWSRCRTRRSRSSRAARTCSPRCAGDCHSHSELVRRRQPHRGDGADRRRARPRVAGAHRPLAPAARRQRPHRRAADQAARRSSTPSTRSLGGQFRLLKGIEVDILDDGGLDQTDAMLAQARPRHRQRALQAAG